ncbi:hypothetical protein PRIPAC_93973 [Pristionchus pacificus]|uniref:Membrane transporter n=1 Tax=Pristionchus pacificus TaxID=54126 RepID=A0A2A6CEE2_PRIPA|nr:hypothetical protein PRIPAC_93973 [Pristionchus pacificus]|eukprot:PDM76423.1 membrane transporter [Pristionchus pacificus]
MTATATMDTPPQSPASLQISDDDHRSMVLEVNQQSWNRWKEMAAERMGEATLRISRENEERAADISRLTAANDEAIELSLISPTIIAMGKGPSKETKNGFRYVRFVILAVSVFYLSFLQASVMAFNTAYVVLSDRTKSPLYSQNQVLVNQSAGSMAPIDSVPKQPGAIATPNPHSLAVLSAHSPCYNVYRRGSLLPTLRPHSTSDARAVRGVAIRIGLHHPAPVFPVIGTIIESWAALGEMGLFVAILTAHNELASLFTLPIGELAIGLLHARPDLCTVFDPVVAGIQKRPCQTPMISLDEVERIKRGKSHGTTVGASPPYRAIFTSKAVWSVFIAAIGTIFVGQFMGIFSPQYFTAVLGYSPTLTGAHTIIPTICMLPVKAITGALSDRMRILSEVTKLRLFNSLACYLGAAVFVVVMLVPPSTTSVSAATALIMIPFILMASCRFNKAAVTISRQHSSFIFSIVHIIDQTSLLIGSFLIPILTPDNTFDEWRIVFIMQDLRILICTTYCKQFIIVLIISNTIFVIFVKAEPEEWAEQKMEFIQLSEEPRKIQRRQTFTM